MNRFGRTHLALTGALLLSIALLAIGCGSDDKASDTAKDAATGVSDQARSNSAREIGVKIKDFSFDMPDTVRGGFVKVTAENTGDQPHQAQIARLNDGVTIDQFNAALRNPDPRPLFGLISFMGGVNTLGPDEKQVAYSTLTPGNYVMASFIGGDDGVPDFAKGMVKPFTVTQGDSGDASPPKAAGTVTMADFNFLGDVNTLEDKKLTLEVKNGGPQPHELTVIKLKEGVTVDQLKAMLNAETPPSGPPPIDDAGGLAAIQANQTGFVELDLDAGKYAFVCFIPDLATAKPHAALGMIKAVEVK